LSAAFALHRIAAILRTSERITKMNSQPEEFMSLEPAEQGSQNRSQKSEERSQETVELAEPNPLQPSNEPRTSQSPELWSKRFSWMVFGVLSMVFLTSIIYRPAEVDPNGDYYTICGFKNLTGLPCPGCGLTHSFCEIGKGHMASAFAWNWMGIPLFLLMILIWCKALFILTRQYRPAFALDKLAARLRPLRLTTIAFAVYGIGRIIYIFLYNPSARTSNPFSKLFSLLGG
jgi:hypothetical protein